MRAVFARCLMLCLMAAPLPVRAQGLAPYLGQWRGEGLVQRGDEPEQRFQCRLVLEDQGPYVRLEGRCASAQGSTSFLYELSERAETPGHVDGISRMLAETTLPPVLHGQIGADGGLVLASDGGEIRFLRQGDDMIFALSGEGARGQVVLRAR